MTAPIRSFFAFSPRVLFICLGELHPEEDAVDGPYGHDNGNRGPEYGANTPVSAG